MWCVCVAGVGWGWCPFLRTAVSSNLDGATEMMVVVRRELVVSGRRLEVMPRTLVVRGGKLETGDGELVVVSRMLALVGREMVVVG